MKKHLHIVSFNVPYPADYGGVIDVFYKLESLHKAGVEIILHCFEYGRPKAEILESFCKKVYYYKRKSGLKYFISKTPYIVNTRISDILLQNLANDKFPVLFEGLHTCGILNNGLLEDRLKIVRAHNVEHHYYRQLAGIENKFKERFFFKKEASKLEKFERILVMANCVLSISPNDHTHFNNLYQNSLFVPAFHPNEKVKSKEGRGNYVLYHGNLSVAENCKAANFLIENVFSKIKGIPVKIAGKNPDKSIFANASKHLRDYEIIANPSNQRMSQLIENAQINVLPTFQSTGIKLKLIAALFSGRHCIVNHDMVDNTGLESLCSIKDSAQEIAEEIKRLFSITFTKMQVESRTEILNSGFLNFQNAAKIVELL
ncbi:MAG: glycosyltransferase [Bacteroidales bacterium]|nr:glycosyltransferase [Bacteroidales bacterium]